MNHLLKEFALESQANTPVPGGRAAQRADSGRRLRGGSVLCCHSEGPPARLLPWEPRTWLSTRFCWEPYLVTISFPHGAKTDPSRTMRIM